MIYTEFHAQIHEDRDDRKRILFAFIILQKHNVLLLLLWVHTNKRRVFTDLKDVLLLSVWPEMEYFKIRVIEHQRLHLSASHSTQTLQ